ncbi:WASH complex subunit 3 isoform X2 [Nilaparvata lugens]|uniref:WASH complex subunit 3 isoform X2 n=1 Tax=Nilaparvata lugens TaxID=108931 RepID=UPI00193E2DE2|nr:WASH complex subunit 3 isoform X2 [Nilaparvata lugens]
MDQLVDIGSDVNLSEVPPINQKRLLAFINEFLINTISLLNGFHQNCESRLQKFDLKMQKLEAELCILESKLKSIPGLEVDLPKVAAAAAADPPQPTTETIAPNNNNLQLDVVDANIPPSKEADTESETPEEEAKVPNPELEKYYKMLRFGVPMEAVKVEMQIDGCDPKLLDSS